MKKFLTTLIVIAGILNICSGAEYAETSASINIENKKVYLGGQTVGVALYSDGLLVTGITSVKTESGESSPCTNAGIKKGDYLVSANGIKLDDVSNMDMIIRKSKGKELSLVFRRENMLYNASVTPVKSDGEYKLGLWLKDGAAGLGTVTFFDPESGIYMALGHSINENSSPLKLKTGRIVKCTVTGVNKGKKSSAGELKGTFGVNASVLGTVEENTPFGLVGKADSDFTSKTEIEFGRQDSVHEGGAEIYTDFDGGEVKAYSIEIIKVNAQPVPQEKSMVIRVTDPDLIEKTGGIVQGLSGSPIVQDNKLIGAVTHVMIADPTRGYGIFIENMLSQTEYAEEKAG